MKAMQHAGRTRVADALPAVSWWLLGVAAALLLGGAWFIAVEPLDLAEAASTSDGPLRPSAVLTRSGTGS